ncbi:MAG: hypothetical protein Q8R08_00180 [bacterium]|nr:hypothetical protein [bacterium]
MPTVDEELQAYQEELERQRQEEFARRRRAQGLAKQAVKQQAVRAGKKVAKRAGMAVGRAVVSGIAAAAPYIGTALLVLAVIGGVIVVIIVTIAYLCNTGGITGVTTQALSFISGGWCDQFSGLSGAVTGAIDRGQNLMCTNTQIIAQQYNVPHPAPSNDPNLVKLIECVAAIPAARLTSCSDPGNASVGSIFTCDNSNAFCNYSRGADQLEGTCGRCAHAENSCHYGGRVGQTGSFAVDFGNEDNGAAILQSAIDCSRRLGITLKRATCEAAENIPGTNDNATTCSNPDATHVHISIAPCTGDNGPINSR